MTDQALPISTQIRQGAFALSPATLTYVLCATGFVLLARSIPDPQLLKFSPYALENIGNVLGPLVLVALFIERAVEVLMTVWREPEAQEAESRVTRAREVAGPDAAATDRGVAAAELDLRRYKAQSRRIAFALTLTLGLFAALLGIRAVQQFLEGGVLPTDITGAQKAAFVRFDMFITAAMIAGGAEGIHRVVSAFTAFADASKKRAQSA
jgi:hypothetical protein